MKLQKYILSFILPVLFAACVSSPLIRDYGHEIETDLAALSRVYKNSFPLGAAAEPFQLEGAEGALLAYHFNSLTAENAMKFRTIHPEEDTYNFEPADQLAAFAKENHMKMRGHTFVWHHPDEIASWVFADGSGRSRSRDEVLAILKDHMSALIDRYGDIVYAWDVVNEAVDTSQPDNMRRTPWYNSIGPDYVDQAFLLARELAPNAGLFLNDYETFEPAKRDALFSLVKGMKERGIPVDGVGLQLHLTLSHPPLEEIEKTIDLFRTLDVEIHITELDMSLYSREFQTMEEPDGDSLIRQAHRYKDLFDIFVKNDDIITSVTFWGFNDGHTYRTGEPYNRPDWPLPFDDAMKAKLAYHGIIRSDDLPDDVVLEEPRQNKTYQAPKGTPLIDGEIDPVWEAAPVVLTDTQVMNAPGAVAAVRMLWDEEHLYVLAEVADSTVSDNADQAYMNDSFEFFIDELNDKTVALGKDDSQIRIGHNNDMSFGGQGWKDKIKSATRITDDGYLVELMYILQKVKGEPGLKMGMDFQVNDNFGNAEREGISKWNDPTNESWHNTTGWGTLELYN
ncbi:endo-1,4-beta-xylanase [Spirochaeta isovalerica]|uniref:Beta-xylanase n=1 Tax=Spirochaeta isovalerica TaxID=150 RepID=A0A841RBJ3_9SPIO|nr:GH35 family endo-1,4-beta-xylanase [Spirochaeta isovalerica]